jgi:pimeloyl-ACP methyl ester carboxylesterase
MLIRINGIDLDYRDYGTGIPLVFLHAFPVNQQLWTDQLDKLQNHCRAISLDLRGFGQSTALEGTISMDQMAADVRELLTALGIHRVVLVGLSMGGYVSFAFYRMYRESVRAMVLADTRATADTPEARERRYKSADRVERNGVSSITEETVSALLGHTSIEQRPSVVQRVRTMIESNSPAGIAGAQRGMAARRDSTDLLPDVDIPVLVISGAEDNLTPVAEMESMQKAIRGSRLMVIEAAGHLSNIECPDEFNAALLDFIESVRESES